MFNEVGNVLNMFARPQGYTTQCVLGRNTERKPHRAPFNADELGFNTLDHYTTVEGKKV